MSNFILKYKANVKEEKNMAQIKHGKKINKDLLIAVEKDNYKLILFDLKLKKKIFDISFTNLISHLLIFVKNFYI